MSLLAPARYIASVDLIDLDALAREGVRTLLIDRDNTLVPRDSAIAPPGVVRWLDRARELGFALCLVSNNWHGTEVSRSAEQLGMGCVFFACKPLPFAVWRAMRVVGAEADSTVIIGDQLFTDVLAGRLAGIRSILVKPQCRSDLWYTHIFRFFERRVLRGVPCEGSARS